MTNGKRPVLAGLIVFVTSALLLVWVLNRFHVFPLSMAEKERRLTHAGKGLAIALWAPRCEDPLGLKIREEGLRDDVPSRMFRSSTEYFQFCYDNELIAGDSVSSIVLDPAYSSDELRPVTTLQRSKVLWSVVADNPMYRVARHPVLLSRNIRMESLDGPAIVEPDTELGIDFGVVVYSSWSAQVIRASVPAGTLCTGFTNRILRP